MTRQWRLPTAFGLSVSAVASIVACGGGTTNGFDEQDSGVLLPSADSGARHPPTADTGTTPDAPSTLGDVTAPSADATSPEPGEQDASTTPPSYPQVINAHGGVLATPVIVAIFFSNDDSTLPTLESFYAGVASTPFWQAASEYGVGAATETNVVLTQAAPATIDDTGNQQGDTTALQAWLLAEIANGDLPAATPNTEYLINYPPGTTVTSDGNQCTDFDGYHSDVQDSAGAIIAYGVIPRCQDPGSTYLDTFTETASHELVEAATDPYPDYSAGWLEADNRHLFWDEANSGSEIGDMCQNDPEAYVQFSTDFPFKVQRFWSNASVLLGHDPCVPEIPGKVFFNAIPELADTGTFDYYGSTVTVSSVSIPVGGSKTIDLDLYSDGSTADWDVQAFDYNSEWMGGTALLTLDMPTTTGNNGSRLPVTITVKGAGNANTNGEVDNTELFFIQSSQGTSQTAPTHYWFGIVTN